jgi:hypothetical protein
MRARHVPRTWVTPFLLVVLQIFALQSKYPAKTNMNAGSSPRDSTDVLRVGWVMKIFKSFWGVDWAEEHFGSDHNNLFDWVTLLEYKKTAERSKDCTLLTSADRRAKLSERTQ